MMQTVIDEFDLAEHLDTLPGSLPQGTRRLVGIARAMLTEPDILFLDEPAAGLDVHETQEFGHLLRRVANDYRVAVVLVEHDVPLVMETCDHVIVLNFGEKIAEDAPASIRVNTDVIAAYLGEPDEEESGQLAAEIAQRVAELTPVGNERSGP
jgi:sulfate-transporting ATPase